MRAAIAVAAVLVAAAGVWWLVSRTDAPTVRDGADASEAAGAPPAAAGLEVTTDPKRKSFTRAETIAGKAPPGEIRGVVDGPEGAPRGGLRVTARSRIPFRPAATTTTQPDGAFRLQGVEDGQVDVMLGDVPEGWSAPSALAAGGGTALRLRLERTKPKEPGKAVEVAVTVRDPAGRPVAKARVKVQGRRDEKNFTTSDSDATDAEGVAHVEIEDPGAHLWLGVERPEDRDDVFDLEIDDWKPKDETLTLKPAARLKGVLTFADGAPFAFGHVVWRIKDGPWTRAQIFDDGSFSSAQVPPGPVQVIAFDTWTWVEEPYPPDTKILDVDPSKGPIRIAAGATSPGWLNVRLGPLEGHHVTLVSMGRLVGDRKVVDVDAPWRDAQEGEVLLFRAISVASRYQVYARRDDGKIAFATDLTAGGSENVIDLPWKDPKAVRVTVQWPPTATLRAMPFISLGLPLNSRYVGSPFDRALLQDFVIDGVPDGTWTVLVHLDNGEEVLDGSVDVPAGGTGRLDVRRTVPPPR